MYSEIEAKDLFDKISTTQPILIDVRNNDEVLRGIITGAIHIPLPLLPLQYESISKDSAIIFYCHSGVRSAHAADFMTSKGYKNISHLRGGILAWARAGYQFTEKTREKQ
jgi:rhodanese-related sulfurtransferase